MAHDHEDAQVAEVEPAPEVALGREVFRTDEAPEEDRREIRLCVVMTGGVSLAVWMGGVAAEIYRAARASTDDPDAGVYREVLDETWSRVVVDVLAGTSAGGLNGALLGAATTADLDAEQFLDIRDLWLDMGSFRQLLRSPSSSDPPSMLRGDTWFLPRLRELFDSWLPPGRGLGPDLEVILTGTLLSGRVDRHVDSFGTALVEAEYRTQFHFDVDDLADDLAPGRLALAARSSASFPGAFEASFVPAGPGPDRLHPSMASVLSLDANRYVVDGGILVNQPIGPALDAVFRRAASRDLRRVLLYVNPDPADPDPLPAPTRAPALLDVLRRTTLVIPRKQTIGAELGEIEQHNRTAELQRRARSALLATGDITTLAEELWGAFVERRSSDAVRDTISQVASAVRHTDLATIVPGVEWYDIEYTLASALADTTTDGRRGWLGDRFPSTDDLPPNHRSWSYGIAPLEYSISAQLDLLRQVQEATSVSPGSLPIRDRIRNLRGLLHGLRVGLQDVRSVSQAYWRTRVEGPDGLVSLVSGAADQDPDTVAVEFAAGLGHWARAAHERWPTPDTPTDEYVVASFRALGTAIATADDLKAHLADLAASIAAVSGAVSRLVLELEDSGVHVSGGRSVARGLAPEFGWILGTTPGTGATHPTPADLLRRLLALHVVQTALHGPPDAREQPVELVQISANQSHGVDPGRGHADAKLAGLQLAHFGAFAKPSWRANDWLWGRLDGAARILRVLVEPARIRRLTEAHCTEDPTADPTAVAVEVVRRLAVGPEHGEGAAWRAERFEREHRAGVEAELAWLRRQGDRTGRPPRSLPLSAAAICARLHEQILQEELPILAWSILKSAKEGAAMSPAAAAFAEDVAGRLKRRGRLRADETVELLAAARIASETVQDERRSLAFLELTTGSLAVATAALAGRRGGLGSLGTLLVPARWATLGVHRTTGVVNDLRRRFWADERLQGVPDHPPRIRRER